MEHRIGELARMAGATASAVRYYEQVGLLPPPRRSGDQRRYGDADVRRLTFIRRCREFGFPVDQVRGLLALMHDGQRSCTEARDIAAAHLESIREQLDELHELERSIAGCLEAADATCPGGSADDCVVLHELAGPRRT